MTAPNLPCSNCRQRHIKCDKQRPKCGRCQSRSLECVPVERKGVFRRGSKDVPSEGFATDQTWVNSTPRKWRGPKGAIEESGSRAAEGSRPGRTSGPSQWGNQPPAGSGATAVHLQGGSIQDDVQDIPMENGPFVGLAEIGQPVLLEPYTTATTVSGLDALVSAAVGIQHESPVSGVSIVASQGSPLGYVNNTSPQSSAEHSTLSNLDVQPLANVEEACLLRYFIEELSPWFDHCDDQSHFRLVVPLRAQTCLTLRNAILAVSSRHLSRLPQFKTSQGIVYQGQTHTNLTTSSAVEYMLECIPGLSSFHTVQDLQVQENLMAAAIILRHQVSNVKNGRQQRVNFLAITKTIIYSMISSPLSRSSLATAAYWIAIRQEVYYALTRKRPPCVTLTPEDWANATVANMMIMHAGEVAKWCWGDRSFAEYERLRTHQQHLITTYASHLLPILQKPADKSKGEIFPTVWYTTQWQVTGVQHLELARMILIAENPRLREPTTPRTTIRKAESLVCSIVLNLCGIAVHNVSSRLPAPALVNAVIAILLYGEYFTDQRERDALRGIIDDTKDMHAWPLRRPYERLCRAWAEGDAAEV